MSVESKCLWCGRPLRKSYRTQKYHRGRCTSEARKEQKRISYNKNKFKYYNKNRALGNCNLAKVYNKANQEREIKAEMRRLGLSSLL